MIASNKKIPIEKMKEIINDMNEKEYGYVLFDGHPKSFDNARIGSGIFP